MMAFLMRRRHDSAISCSDFSPFADRTGRVYGREIVPDEEVSGYSEIPAEDPVVQAGIKWLRTMCR
jgi:hypothetical protein